MRERRVFCANSVLTRVTKHTRRPPLTLPESQRIVATGIVVLSFLIGFMLPEPKAEE